MEKHKMYVNNCPVSDEQRDKGMSCRGMHCKPCAEARKNTYDKLEEGLMNSLPKIKNSGVNAKWRVKK